MVSCNTKVANQESLLLSFDNREAAFNRPGNCFGSGSPAFAVIKFSQDIKNQNEREKGLMDAMRDRARPVEPDEIHMTTKA